MTLTVTTPRTGTTSGASSRAAAPATRYPPALAALGGTRALVDGGLPPLVFVAVHAVVGAQTTRSTALVAAIGAAAATGLGIVALRLIRAESLRQALGGLAGRTVAVPFAAPAGEARVPPCPGSSRWGRCCWAGR